MQIAPKLATYFVEAGPAHVILLEQQQDWGLEMRSCFETSDMAQAFSSTDMLRDKALYALSSSFPLNLLVKGAPVTQGYDLIQRLFLQPDEPVDGEKMVEEVFPEQYLAVAYLMQIDDQMSPFVRDSKFWTIRETRAAAVLSSSQLCVCAVFIDTQAAFKRRLQVMQ